MKKLLLSVIFLSVVGLFISIWFLTPLGEMIVNDSYKIKDDYIVKFEDKQVEMPVQPVYYKGQYFLPLETIANFLGYRWGVDGDNAYITTYDKSIDLTRDSKTIEITKEDQSGQEQIETAPMLVDSVFVIPLNFISKYLDMETTLKSNQIVLNRTLSTLVPYEQALEVFKEGMTAKVTDIKTGTFFEVKRVTGGFNTLADVETLTKEETEKLKSTNNGNWGVTNRPIMVEVDGVKFAASISLFPHSGREDLPFGEIVDNRNGGTGRGINLDSIRDNDLVGVVDIYFYNSIIPGINRVDPRQQQAVIEAAQYMAENEEK